MIFKIIDETHIKLVASAEEQILYDNHSRILIDNITTFVSSSTPSASSFIINRPEQGTLFNVDLDISNSPFTTNELLFAYLELADSTYPFIFPIYNSYNLLNLVAEKAGIFQLSKDSDKFIQNALPILAYYGFKLALSVMDLKAAIKYWETLNNSCSWGLVINSNKCSDSIFGRCQERYEVGRNFTINNCCCHEN